MKKVYGLLLVLLSLTLLDGTPIHNCHGKFISVRNKMAIHEIFDATIGPSFCDQFVFNDDNSENERSSIARSNPTPVRWLRVPDVLSYSPGAVTGHAQTIPLYRLVRSLRT